jgi:hypothetical protein
MSEEDKTEQTPKTQPPGEPSQQETAMMIADQLDEKEPGPRTQLVNIVRALGRTQARTLLQETLDIEAKGGMMLPDGSRRRTPGGIYFHLAYTKGIPKKGKTLRRPMYRKPDSGRESTASPPQEVLTFTWEDRIAVIREAEEQKGNANVKITLVGRPGKIVDRGTCIVTVMESTKIPALPKGLPAPANVVTKYAVYIASKQWKKVQQAIADAEDVLIVEGYPQIDTQTSALSVFATNVSTKKLQQALKEAQKAKQQETV